MIISVTSELKQTVESERTSYPNTFSYVHFHFLCAHSKCKVKTCSQASTPRSSPYRLCCAKDRLDPERTSDSVLEISSSMSQGGLCSDTRTLRLILLNLKAQGGDHVMKGRFKNSATGYKSNRVQCKNDVHTRYELN